MGIPKTLEMPISGSEGASAFVPLAAVLVGVSQAVKIAILRRIRAGKPVPFTAVLVGIS